MPFNKSTGSTRPAALRVDPSSSDSGAYQARSPHTQNRPEPQEQSEQQKGFISSHFGNPEQVHVYGAGNDYESEEEVKEEEKAAAGQFIWYFGALVLFLFVGYILFGLRR
jgi:hypothetical protein